MVAQVVKKTFNIIGYSVAKLEWKVKQVIVYYYNQQNGLVIIVYMTPKASILENKNRFQYFWQKINFTFAKNS